MKKFLAFCILITSAFTSIHSENLLPEPVRINENTYAIIGDLSGMTYENEGMNANVGFVIMEDAVLLINTGSSVRAAKAIHEKIKKITDKPVKWAVVLNSRPHYWLGNSYYHSIGTKIISSKSTDREIRATGEMLLNQMKGTLREKASGTAIVYSNILFEKEYIIRSGKKSAVIIDVGPAHTAGDSAVWLPDSKILFSGDVVFTERMVAVISTGNTKSWVNAFDTLMKLKPVLIVPGHGKVSNVKKAQQDTKEYLVYIRSRVKEKFDNMVGLQETIESVDQSKYKYLKNFDDLAKRNIHFLYLELEIEELK